MGNLDESRAGKHNLSAVSGRSTELVLTKSSKRTYFH